MEFGTAYFDNIIVRHFREDLEEIQKQGCTFLVLTFSEINLQFHEKTFAEMVREAKRAELKVVLDPWAVGGVFGGETFTHLPMYHPQERQVRSDGRPVPALCPNGKALKRYLKMWIEAAARIKPDYLLWDEPHFYMNWWDKEANLPIRPKAWSCLCPFCREKFERETGEKMPKTETETVRDFKRRSLMRFLVELCRYADRLGLRNAMTFFPNEKEWFLEKMAQEKSVHVLGSESYFEYDQHRPKDPRKFAREQTELLKPFCRKHDKPLLMWVKGFRVPKGFEKDVEECLWGCAEGGADWLALWGFEACRHVSKIACDDPEKVWNLMGKTFRQLKGRGRANGRTAVNY